MNFFFTFREGKSEIGLNRPFCDPTMFFFYKIATSFTCRRRMMMTQSALHQPDPPKCFKYLHRCHSTHQKFFIALQSWVASLRFSCILHNPQIFEISVPQILDFRGRNDVWKSFSKNVLGMSGMWKHNVLDVLNSFSTIYGHYKSSW